MNRCASAVRLRAPALACALAVLAAGLVPLHAAAQVHRNFPQNALRGTVAFGQPPEAVLNGDATRLAPGARIHGPDNMIVMSGTLMGQKYTVNYTTEPGGMLFEIWILRAEEAAVRPWPQTPQQATTWSFDPIAQIWTPN